MGQGPMRMVSVLAGLLVMLAGGCAPGRQQVAIPDLDKDMQARPKQEKAGVPEKPQEKAEEAPRKTAAPAFAAYDMTPLQDRLGQRYEFYKTKLAAWQNLDDFMYVMDINDGRPAGWHECRLQLEETVTAYGRLVAPEADDALSPLPLSQAFWLDIDFLESGCGEIYKAGRANYENWRGNFTAVAAEQMEKTVVHYAAFGQYADAVAAYRNLAGAYPDYEAGPNTLKVYALALVRAGRLEEAVAFLGRHSGRTASPEDVAVTRLYADLLLVAGDQEKARGVYQDLARYFTERLTEKRWVDEQLGLLTGGGTSKRELSLFVELLRAYLLFDGKQVPAEMQAMLSRLESIGPGSVVANRARQILWLTEEQAGAWVGRQLILVDELVEEKEFGKALEVLDKLLAEKLPAEVSRIVRDTRREVAQLMAADLETQQMLKEQSQTIQWDKAVRLFDLRKFNEAIEAFALLIDTDYDAKAREKMAQAINLAAGEMRRQAAALFVKARNVTGAEAKKELLLESRRLLQSILEKYPEADIIDKVRVNLSVLEEQIRALDPTLLGEPAPLDAPVLGQEPGSGESGKQDSGWQ